jgi:hypothetical protein
LTTFLKALSAPFSDSSASASRAASIKRLDCLGSSGFRVGGIAFETMTHSLYFNGTPFIHLGGVAVVTQVNGPSSDEVLPQSRRESYSETNVTWADKSKSAESMFPITMARRTGQPKRPDESAFTFCSPLAPKVFGPIGIPPAELVRKRPSIRQDTFKFFKSNKKLRFLSTKGASNAGPEDGPPTSKTGDVGHGGPKNA